MSATPQNGGLQSTLDLALAPEWGNTASKITRVVVPKGTTVFEGFAAPQSILHGIGMLPGGGSQIYIPYERLDPKWFIN